MQNRKIQNWEKKKWSYEAISQTKFATKSHACLHDSYRKPLSVNQGTLKERTTVPFESDQVHTVGTVDDVMNSTVQWCIA